tara:strand:- start:1195 stop:1488 length:294 start_codon:yes stop_codon:yes gene_type:complete
MSPEEKREFDKDALIAELQHELDQEISFSNWLKYFSSYIYAEHREVYDKASNRAYELLKINKEGEEADERRKEILEQEGKQTTSGKKDSKSRMDGKG